MFLYVNEDSFMKSMRKIMDNIFNFLPHRIYFFFLKIGLCPDLMRKPKQTLTFEYSNAQATFSIPYASTKHEIYFK